MVPPYTEKGGSFSQFVCNGQSTGLVPYPMEARIVQGIEGSLVEGLGSMTASPSSRLLPTLIATGLPCPGSLPLPQCRFSVLPPLGPPLPGSAPPPALTVPGTQCRSTTFTICRISEVGRHCCEDIAIPLGSPCARATHQAWWLAREFCVFSSGGLPSRSQLPKLAVTTLPPNSERGGTQKIGNRYTK